MPLTASLVQSLVFQLLVAGLTLAFGLTALKVAPGPGTSAPTAAWFMAGVTFAQEGALGTFHALMAVAAVLAGEGSQLLAGYMRLTPAGNDARNVVVLGFALALGWVVALERPAPGRRTIVAAATALIAAGFVAGLAEPPVESQRGGDHFTVMACFGAATAVLLFAVLYRAMMRESMDWLLWIALAVYAAQEALSADIQSALSWAGFHGGWSPPPRSMHWVGAVSALVMLACAVRRLAIARAGGDAPGLLERLRR
jgi:hypothetical protein